MTTVAFSHPSYLRLCHRGDKSRITERLINKLKLGPRVMWRITNGSRLQVPSTEPPCWHWHALTPAAVPSALPSKTDPIMSTYTFKKKKREKKKQQRFTNTHFCTDSPCLRFKGELLARAGRRWKSAPYQQPTDSDCSDSDTSDPSCRQPLLERLCVCQRKFSWLSAWP